MKIITAIEKYSEIDLNGKITCFLAGGITNCWDWQKEVINQLENVSDKNLDDLIIFNPRRNNFPINDPNASREQIKWEFDAIFNSDIFSMYFAGDTTSPQPICFYELGKELGLRYPKFNNIIITCEPNFLRVRDVYEQVDLISKNTLKINTNINEHVNQILTSYENEKIMLNDSIDQLFD